jgi:transposase-like protein
VHPAKPKAGIRAAQANEVWHVDTTLIRLLDGNRAYLHAVIDNFSRRILAWRTAENFDPGVTAQILIEAARSMTSAAVPTALVDGGVENFNAAVDKLVQTGLLKRVLAQTEIQFSNSMIESWWRVLKHQWLYLNTLDHVATVRKLVAFYVEQHNQRLPHSAFQGQTPDEMYFGTGADVPKPLVTARIEARQSRLAANRALNCQNCNEPDSLSN